MEDVEIEEMRMVSERFEWEERIVGNVVEVYIKDTETNRELDEEDMFNLLNQLQNEINRQTTLKKRYSKQIDARVNAYNRIVKVIEDLDIGGMNGKSVKEKIISHLMTLN